MTEYPGKGHKFMSEKIRAEDGRNSNGGRFDSFGYNEGEEFENDRNQVFR